MTLRLIVSSSYELNNYSITEISNDTSLGDESRQLEELKMK